MNENRLFAYKRQSKSEGILLLIMSIILMLIVVLMQIYVPESAKNDLSFTIIQILFGGAGLYILINEAIPELGKKDEFSFVIYTDRVVCHWPVGKKLSSRSQIDINIKEKYSEWLINYLVVFCVGIVFLLIGTDYYNNNPLAWPLSMLLGGAFCIPAIMTVERNINFIDKGYTVKISDIRYVVRTGCEDFLYYITTYDDQIFNIPDAYGNPVGEEILELLKIRPEIKELENDYVTLE